MVAGILGVVISALTTEVSAATTDEIGADGNVRSCGADGAAGASGATAAGATAAGATAAGATAASSADAVDDIGTTGDANIADDCVVMASPETACEASSNFCTSSFSIESSRHKEVDNNRSI